MWVNLNYFFIIILANRGCASIVTQQSLKISTGGLKKNKKTKTRQDKKNLCPWVHWVPAALGQNQRQLSAAAELVFARLYSDWPFYCQKQPAGFACPLILWQSNTWQSSTQLRFVLHSEDVFKTGQCSEALSGPLSLCPCCYKGDLYQWALGV